MAVSPVSIRFPMPVEAADMAMLVDMEFRQYGPSSWLLWDHVTGRRYEVMTDLARMAPMYREAIQQVLRKRPKIP